MSGTSTPSTVVNGTKGSATPASATSSSIGEANDVGQSTKIVNPSGSRKPFVLTPEALEKQRLRKEAKLAAAAAKAAGASANGSSSTFAADENALKGLAKDGRRVIITRQWLDLHERKPAASSQATTSQAIDSSHRFRILSWNMLAQTLVRRKLFPGSDCLKWKDRQEGLAAELKAYPADIICLQEVDRMDVILPQLEPSLGFTYRQVAARGRGKSHGCVVLYREDKFEYKSHKVVVYDEEPIWGSGSCDTASDRRRARGGTRRTTNIGLIVALKRKSGTNGNGEAAGGLVVATTHLFWHPDFSYERARQALILCKHVLAYRAQVERNPESTGRPWDAILAGDFNSQPSEPGYHLVTRPDTPLTIKHKEILERGRVVHDSLDKLAEALEAKPAATTTAEPSLEQPVASGEKEEGDEEGEGDEEEEEDDGEADEVADPTLPKACRRPTDDDGLPTSEQLQAMAREILGSQGLASSYGSSAWSSIDSSYRALTFGGREGGSADEGVSDEPNWSSFTPLWRLQLDYIFAFPSSRLRSPVKLLLPHQTEDMEPGLPRKGVCASDHVLIGAEYDLKA